MSIVKFFSKPKLTEKLFSSSNYDKKYNVTTDFTKMHTLHTPTKKKK